MRCNDRNKKPPSLEQALNPVAENNPSRSRIIGRHTQRDMNFHSPCTRTSSNNRSPFHCSPADESIDDPRRYRYHRESQRKIRPPQHPEQHWRTTCKAVSPGAENSSQFPW